MNFLSKLFDNLDLIIPTALTVWGWYFVFVEGTRLAKRNETFNLFQIAREILEKINEECEIVWSKSASNLSEYESNKLSLYVAELELCLANIKRHYIPDLSINNATIFQLRRLLTCSPYPLNNKYASNEERIKETKIAISNMSALLLNATYENMNIKYNYLPWSKPAN